MHLITLTPTEKLDLVTEYIGLPHGTKGTWRQQRGIEIRQMSTLKRQYFAGDLERGLTPRTIKDMPDNTSARLLQLEKLLAQRDKEIDRLTTELEQASQVNDVLGKAIELVDRFSAPSELTPTEPTSSPKKTGSPKN